MLAADGAAVVGKPTRRLQLLERSADAVRAGGGYRAIFALTLVLEGCDWERGDRGYVNHPADPGGETLAGITISEWRAWHNSMGVDVAPPLRSASVQQVEAFYEQRYWKAVRGEALEREGRHLLAFHAFDWGVNAGAVRGVSYLQAAIGLPPSLVDGRIGHGTLAAAGALTEGGERRAAARYLALRACHYRVRACAADGDARAAELRAAGITPPRPHAPSAVFLAGWLARCRWGARASGVEAGVLYAR